MLKIAAIMGEAGAGKDTILQMIKENSNKVHEIISCTTRPPRIGEIDGKNYHFKNNEGFLNMVAAGDMLEWTEFNSWYYGTSRFGLSLDKVNVGVFNPDGILQLLNHDILLKVYYIKASDKERLIRQLNREIEPDIEEIFRRYHADKADFNDRILASIPHRTFVNETSWDPTDITAAILEDLDTFN